MSGRKRSNDNDASQEDNDDSKEDNSKPPCDKKLRSSDPDVKVILKYTDEETENESEKVYDMYGNVLARMSNFLDAALTVDMREKRTREIVLQDVTPELFEKALLFQQDLSAVRSMTDDDALEVVPFYNMYEFVEGLALCDRVLSEYIAKPKQTALYKLVQITGIAHKYNLPKALASGCDTLNKEVLEKKGEPIRAAMLTIADVESMMPLFKENLLTLPEGVSRDDLESPCLFPKFFVKCMSSRFFASNDSDKASLLFEKPKQSSLDSSNYGRYTRTESGILRNNNYGEISKCGSFSGTGRNWIIRSRATLVFDAWECAGSGDLDVPPSGPWTRVDCTLVGESPFLSYYLW